MNPPSSSTHRLELRKQAAQATRDKFADASFSFENGHDCAKMTAHLLRGLGIKIPLAKVGTYKTLVGARGALRRSFSVDSLPELMDKMFERIPAAAALPADVIQVEGDGPLGTLTIALGNGAVLAYHQDAPGAIVGRLNSAITGWRTLPL